MLQSRVMLADTTHTVKGVLILVQASLEIVPLVFSFEAEANMSTQSISVDGGWWTDSRSSVVLIKLMEEAKMIMMWCSARLCRRRIESSRTDSGRSNCTVLACKQSIDGFWSPLLNESCSVPNRFLELLTKNE